MVAPTGLHVIILLPVAAQYNFPLSLLFRFFSHGGVSDSQIYKLRGNTCSSFRPSHTYTDLFLSESLPGFDLIYWDLIDLSHVIVCLFCTVKVNLDFFVCFGTTLVWVITCPLLMASLHKTMMEGVKWIMPSVATLSAPLNLGWYQPLHSLHIGFPFFKPQASEANRCCWWWIFHWRTLSWEHHLSILCFLFTVQRCMNLWCQSNI